MNDKIWIIYDPRAATMGTEDADVLDTCDDEAEARECLARYYPGGVVFVYDMEERPGQVPAAINERRAW